MGGDISVTSKLGVGTTFTFKIAVDVQPGEQKSESNHSQKAEPIESSSPELIKPAQTLLHGTDP